MLAKFIQFVHPVKSDEVGISPKAKLFNWVKKHQEDIILIIGVILISLLSFAAGYIVAEQQEKEPLKFEGNGETKSSNYWSRNMRPLSGLETF